MNARIRRRTDKIRAMAEGHLAFTSGAADRGKAGNPEAVRRLLPLLLAATSPDGPKQTSPIPGVGEAIADIITKLHRTGTHTTILGHMTGRQLLRRPGYDLDIESVLKACATNHVAVEVNANPWRLDLDWRWHERALELGCLMSINPDAHSTREIDLIHWGVVMGRKGGVSPDRVLNCFTLPRLSNHLKGRARASAA
jgi:hypothetical protein